MPLSTPEQRQFVARRTVTCEGYERSDGLIDIEGRLVDTRGFDMRNDWRGVLKAGNPAHEMWVRLTVDDELTIRAAESCTDAAPYPTCRDITPHTQRLVGLKIVGGFKQEVRSRIGHTEGCTHIIALIDALATVAIQTLAAKRRGLGTDEVLATFGVRDSAGTQESARPVLIDTCHSYAADSPVVEKLWPLHYRPRNLKQSTST